MRKYRLISADSHINEPPDMFIPRVPAKFRDKAPKIVSLPQGDAWVLPGVQGPVPFGLNACGGLGPEKYLAWVRWADVRKGGYQPGPRLAQQDEGGTDAEILYPSPRIGNALFLNTEDPEFHLACIRAYNDWMSEFCSYAPDRLIGIALAPTTGVQAAIAEMKRTMKLPGIKGVYIGRYPSGGLAPSPDDDPFWAEAETGEAPLNIHVGMATAPVTGAPPPFNTAFLGALRFQDAAVRTQEFIVAKIFDRFPKLTLVFAEVDSGWVPYVKEQLDDRYSRQFPGTRPEFKLKPSQYFERNMFFVNVADHNGVMQRHAVGITQIMWSSDFPHGTCNWPNSWQDIARDFPGVPESERHMILAGNAIRVYKLQ